MYQILATWVILLGSMLAGIGHAGDSISDQALLERFRGIALGAYQLKLQDRPAVGPDDVKLCMTGLRRDDVELRAYASLGISRLAREPFFEAAARDHSEEMVRLLTEEMIDEHDDLSEWSCRAVIELVRNTSLVGEAPTADIVERALWSARDRNPELRRRSSLVLRELGPRLEPADRRRVVLELLREIARRSNEQGDREQVALQGQTGVLAAIPIEDPRLAGEVADLLLADLDRVDRYAVLSPLGLRLNALARIAPLLEAERRNAIIELLIDRAADLNLLYSVTSGRRTPLRHCGADALAIIVPHLDQQQTRKALARVAAARAEGARQEMEEIDLASMYDQVIALLEERIAGF